MYARATRDQEELPAWWYSPARNNVEQPPKTAEGSRTTTEVPGTNGKSVEQTDALIPATPITPTYREGGSSRPPLPVQYRSVPSGTGEYERVPGSTTELPVGTDDFTSAELDLLGSKGVVRSPQGEFINRILEKNGFTSKGVIRRERAQENDHPCKPPCGATSSGDVHANGTVTSRTAETPNLRAPVGT